jgi:hypothetical protein
MTTISLSSCSRSTSFLRRVKAYGGSGYLREQGCGRSGLQRIALRALLSNHKQGSLLHADKESRLNAC